jgi:tripartite-type tricarboxylate transporter receptor subunit TctC
MSYRRFLPILALALSATLPAAGWAQNYPSKPIRLLVPFGAGSTSDVIARLIGQGISADLGQPVIVDNRPGAGGTIGAAEAARAAPDGHLLVLGTVASHAIAPYMMQGVKYDPVKDFQPITVVATAPSVIVVHRSVPASDLKEFIAYLKSHPDIDYSSAGLGTTAHLAGEALNSAAGVRMTHVPYKAVGQAITDLLAGTVKVMFYQLPSVKPYIASHGLKIVGVTSLKPMPSLPNVAAVSEMYPGYDFSAWFGMFAPANTPKPVIDRLYKSIMKAIDTPEFKQLMAEQGLEPSGITPDAFQSFMKTEVLKWKKITSDSAAKLQSARLFPELGPAR